MPNIAEKIFLTNLEIMKAILDLGEYKLDGDKAAYRYFKKSVMNTVYSKLTELFNELEQSGLLKKCSCKANLRQGYTDCLKCHGAGMVNASENEGKSRK